MKNDLESPPPDVSGPSRSRHGLIRSRWAAIGAAIAVSLGAGGLSIVGASSDASGLIAIRPCRVVDTRIDLGPRSGPLDPATPQRVPITGNQGQCRGIPTNATAVSLNVTAVNPTAPSFLTVWPAGQSRPNASNLNYAAGSGATPNAVIVALGSGGAIDVFNEFGNVDLIIDVNGYFVPGSGGTGGTGPAGPAGRSAWDQIPPGLTVTGSASMRTRATGNDQQFWFSVNLPGRASVQLTSSLVNFPATDAQCTGSPANPTAPPGKVCLYETTSTSNATSLQGFELDFQRDSGFIVAWRSTSNNPTTLEVVWAYRQPG